MKKEKISFEDHQSKAAKAGWARLTPEERTARARRAVQARWAKKHDKSKESK